MNHFWPRYIADVHGVCLRTGETCPAHKLNSRQVAEIRQLTRTRRLLGGRRSRAGDLSQRALGKRYGVHQTIISLITTGKTWKNT